MTARLCRTAKLTISGLDDLTNYLKEKQQLTGPMAKSMLDSGAEELVKEWKAKIAEKDHVDKRAMIDSVAAKETEETNTGFLKKTVYPQGKDKKGVRNAEKAFLLHYGWKTNAATNGPHDGDHFVDEIVEESEPKVASAMEQTMEKFLQEGK